MTDHHQTAVSAARPEPTGAAGIDLQACGCARVNKASYGHTCTIHDEEGKRWDAYTLEEVERIIARGSKVEVQTDKTDWSCYCGRHGDDGIMAVGTRCIWGQVNYEHDEWECQCIESYRASWLNCQTTDWIALAKASGHA